MTGYDAAPRGVTFNAVHDENRVTTLQARVYRLMADRRWRTLAEIRAVTGGSESGVSARLRDLRKNDPAVNPYGPHNVERLHRGPAADGLYEYRLGKRIEEGK